MFDNLADAQQKLQQSIVLYQGIPVFVHAVLNSRPDGIFRVYFKPIPLTLPVDFNNDPDEDEAGVQEIVNPFRPMRGDDMRELDRRYRADGCIRKKINSPHFNGFRPITLGYMNHFEGTNTLPIFVVRSTARQYSQGVKLRTLTFERPALFNEPVDRMGEANLARSIGFKEMVANEYPSIKDAIDVIKDDSKAPKGVAVSRDVAIMYQSDLAMYLVFVRNQLVGYLDDSQGDRFVVSVSKEKRHLKEILEGVGFVVNVKNT